MGRDQHRYNYRSGRELIDTLKVMTKRVMKVEFELYYCKFSKTTYPDCSIKANIEKFGSQFKSYLFGHDEHDESNLTIELLKKGFTYEKKQLCLEILKKY
ncbi:hypothetical protein LOD99_12151 [Oopsacas minuta]|uniref:Uncharacterized protein n=1 Tax=Oopsacas minuta TaxID=111878 RepID=A0AAV7JHQ4_9METZ|nr:hypothetical protein LOD99_12151 [Oopsacas minuta]